MRVLFHLPLDAACRETRIHIAEKGLECELKAEKVWERREDFLQLNPAGEVPVLVDEDHAVIPGARVISEYLEEAYPEPSLLGRKALDRAEVRRLVEWFALKFQREVTKNLVDEKIMKRFLGLGQPPSVENFQFVLQNLAGVNGCSCHRPDPCFVISMIINKFHVLRSVPTLRPFETDAPLSIDRDTVLAAPVAT